MAFPAAPLALISPAHAHAFAELDERVVAAHPGIVLVRAPIDVHGPILAHASRRLRTSGWSTIEVLGGVGVPIVREVAVQLGLPWTEGDAVGMAEAIVTAALARRAVLLARLPAEGTWDRLVASELARSARVLVLFVTDESPPAWPATDTSLFEVTGELGGGDKLRWLSAIAEEAQAELAPNDLRRLEGWWSNARRAAPNLGRSASSLGRSSLAVAEHLALAGRSLPMSAILATVPGASEAIGELASAGFVRAGSRLTLDHAPDELIADLERGASSEMRVAVASWLSAAPGFDADPWAHARAAELFVSAGRHEDADAAIARAMRAVTDTQIRGEIATRWFRTVSAVAGGPGLELRIAAANRAVRAGEANEALRWCDSASALRAETPRVALALGRALVQLGDLVAARVALQGALDAAPPRPLRAALVAELAEVRYLASDLDGAASLAEEAIELADRIETRLDARNTLGKILLARARWDEADAHFAEDVLSAVSSSAANEELRARLNRGIVLMSKGLLDDARSVMERVLSDGTRLGEDRARAFALSNLAVIAYRKHEYGTALSCWEQSVRFPVALRGRLATARSIANLAELRLRLGLIEHAEHAIAFGRRLLGSSVNAARSSHFAVVAARIALARGNTASARREIESALADAESAGDRDYLGEAFRVAARIALDDGDVRRAGEAIGRAETLVSNDRGRADVAVVDALRLRALGQDALERATSALSLARASGEEDLLAEIHTLLAVLHRDAGSCSRAEEHCSRALAVRDQVAAGLPADVRAAFLARPDIVALARLQSSLAGDEADASQELPRARPTSPPMPAREIVGDDPQMRNLLVAIRKVARANSTVLIRGESGTGKELVAEALHRGSERAGGPLVTVNCAALVETLLLSELFGHEKGAFTGASTRRRGRFEMAEGGTLFLDEIGDVSPRTQVALLRVLQEKTFERVGGTTPIRANVRVLCATHRDLKAMVERGEFREDLYYRLRGITLEVPALRQRISDLPKIAEHVLARIALERNERTKGLSRAALDLLSRHKWPGNVRELENVLRAASLFAEADVITEMDLIDNVDDLRTVAQSGFPSQPPVSLRASVLPSSPSSVAAADAADEDEGERPLPTAEAGATAAAYATVRQGAVSLSDMKRQIERDCIARALAETKGNITRAAALLGMKRPRLSQLVKQYGLTVSSSEGNP